MIHSFKRITIVSIRRPGPKTLNQEIQQFSNSLGLFNLRDKEKSCYRIFIELMKSAKSDKPLSSDELAYKLNLTRGTVVHHLNRLMDSGMAVAHRNKYMLRTKNLAELIEKLDKDTKEFFKEIRKLAKEIDEKV